MKEEEVSAVPDSAVVELCKADYARIWEALMPLERRLSSITSLDRANFILGTPEGRTIIFTYRPGS